MDVLAGVDAVPWATLDHCFGPSDDIPDLLRQTAAGSEDALWALDGYMAHQGGLYEATPYLVRFLARIAAANAADTGITRGILDVLGGVASLDTDRYQGPDLSGETRGALAEQLTGLIPLLADPADEIRDAAAWALPQSLAADFLIPPLRARLDQETQPEVTASVLRGLSFLDPAGTVPLAAEVLDGGDSAIRLIAAWACVTGGMPWSSGLRAAALGWTADGALLGGFRWSSWSGHPFSDLAGELAERGDPLAAAELVSAALTGPAAPGVRKKVMLAAGHLADISRAAAPALIAPLASVVAGDDPEASVSAVRQLLELGALASAADELARVAAVEGPSRRADAALSGLLQVGDPRFVTLLARDHRHRPFTMDALRHPTPPATRPLFSAALLEEIRRCLRERLLGEEATPMLARLIGSWGPAAGAAAPDLLAVLPAHAYSVGCALADIGGAVPEVVDALRQAAGEGTMGLSATARLYAAARLRELTGEEDLLLTAVESGLTQTGHGMREAAEAARTLSPIPRLVPALTVALDGAAGQDPPDDGTRMEVALALWHHCGDPAPAVAVIAERLRAEADYPRGGAAAAARAAVVLGSAARPLIPAILPLLDSPRACPAAVEALMRIDQEHHGGIPLPALAERLLLPLGRAHGYVQLSAVQALGEIGPGHLPAHVVVRLRELADQDRRIGQGSPQTLIHDDDRLRAAIRDLIGDPPRAGFPA